MPGENESVRGVCSFCGDTVEVLDNGCLAEHLDGEARCGGAGVPLFAQDGAPTPSVELLLRDADNDVLLVVERERDPMWLRFIAGAEDGTVVSSASLHRDQIREVVGYLDDVTQAARAVMMRAVIDVSNGSQPEPAAVDWAAVLPRGAEEFDGREGRWVGLDLVVGPLVRFALSVQQHGVAGFRLIGLVMSIDQARGLRDDLRRTLAWMDVIEGFDTMGDAA